MAVVQVAEVAPVVQVAEVAPVVQVAEVAPAAATSLQCLMALMINARRATNNWTVREPAVLLSWHSGFFHWTSISKSRKLYGLFTQQK